jgi:hypothetical protein
MTEKYLRVLERKTVKPTRYEMLRIALELAGCCEHSNEPSGSIKGGVLVV